MTRRSSRIGTPSHRAAVIAVTGAKLAVLGGLVAMSGLRPRWLELACLVLSALVAMEVERRAASGDAPGRRVPFNLQSIWMVPVLLLLGPVDSMLLVACQQAYLQLRQNPAPPLHRLNNFLDNALPLTVATALAMQFGVQPHHWHAGAVALGVVAVAVFATMNVTLAAFSRAMLLGEPLSGLRPTADTLRVEAATLAVGFAITPAAAAAPLLLAGAVPLVWLVASAVQQPVLLEQLRTDAKTGLASLRYWREVALGALTVRPTGGHTVLVADVDHFKRVNDLHGHLVGDDVLRRIAEVLRDNVRRKDLVGRFGGEEFVVFLPDTSPSTSLEIAERLRGAVASADMPASLGAGARVTVSIGCAETPDTPVAPPTALDDVLGRADSALYEAKAAGRDRVRACPSMPRPAA